MYILDEYDLNVFHTEDEKSFFKEVISTYYSNNYRSSIVMLYSLLVLNLYNKLQLMANEDSKADTKLNEINGKIKTNNTKYSEIEKELINYFNENHPLVFIPIKKDIEYLKTLRDGCTHLSVNNERLFVPKEHQVRMMIISIYQNIFSKDPPFIQNLFNFLEDKLEYYGQRYNAYQCFKEDEYSRLKKLYFSRMSKESIEKSIPSFIKFAFSKPTELQNKKDGAFFFLYNISYFCEESGLFSVWSSSNVHNRFSMLDSQLINDTINQKQLYELIKISSYFRDMIKEVNDEFFSKSINNYLYSSTLEFIQNAKKIYPDKEIFQLLKENYKKVRTIMFNALFDELNKVESNKIDCNNFALESVEMVPSFNGFDTADLYFDFLIEHFLGIDKQIIDKVFEKIKQNDQFINRHRFKKDIIKIKELNEKRSNPVVIPDEWMEKSKE